jgi:hypothetical protein
MYPKEYIDTKQAGIHMIIFIQRQARVATSTCCHTCTTALRCSTQSRRTYNACMHACWFRLCCAAQRSNLMLLCRQITKSTRAGLMCPHDVAAIQSAHPSSYTSACIGTLLTICIFGILTLNALWIVMACLHCYDMV